MLRTHFPPTVPAMAVTDKRFYVQLGQRVAQRRKAQGLTQVELAERLGIAQQTLAHYEAGKLRVAIAMLPTLADTLGMSFEDLIGAPAARGAGKRGPAPKIQQQLEQIGQLPRAKQRLVSQFIDTVLQQHA
jgi:transcriptional regulator with XRE-family HTH domain